MCEVDLTMPLAEGTGPLRSLTVLGPLKGSWRSPSNRVPPSLVASAPSQPPALLCHNHPQREPTTRTSCEGLFAHMILTILSVILAAAFLIAGAARIRMIPVMFNQARTLGIHYPQFRLIGVLEVVFALCVLAGIWVSWLGTFGSLMLTIMMAVAILAHARANDALKNYAPASVLGILAFIIFLIHIYE